jgi:putative ABC transport system substrate-binding protein
MADEPHRCESRLVALKARKQRWLAKLTALEGVRGASVRRGQARQALRIVDAEIVVAESKLRAAQMRAATTENREIAAEECMSNLDELRTLAAACDGHAQALGIAVKELRSKLSAAAETTSISVVFAMGEGLVKEGVVVNLNRPIGNVTGVSYFSNVLFAKRLQLLHELVPTAAVLALLVNPKNPNAEPDAREAQAAADALGRQLQVLTASTDQDLETAFDAIVQRRIGGLIVGVDPVFVDHREKLPALAARNGVPVIFDRRDFPAAGGLMSYGTDIADAYRHCGSYVGRILKGEKPANLPVLQSTKFEFVINLKTKTLGIAFPPGVLAIADEVIE